MFIILGALVGGSIAGIMVLDLFPILTWAIFIILIFVLIVIMLGWFTTTYAMTNIRLEHQIGIIGTKNQFIEIKNISSVEMHQTMLGRVLDYGDIVIEGDSALAHFVFKNINNPKKYHRIIANYYTNKKIRE